MIKKIELVFIENEKKFYVQSITWDGKIVYDKITKFIINEFREKRLGNPIVLKKRASDIIGYYFY